MTHRISIHDFHADPADTVALACEHGLVEVYDDEGDCVLTVSPGLLEDIDHAHSMASEEAARTSAAQLAGEVLRRDFEAERQERVASFAEQTTRPEGMPVEEWKDRVAKWRHDAKHGPPKAPRCHRCGEIESDGHQCDPALLWKNPHLERMRAAEAKSPRCFDCGGLHAHDDANNCVYTKIATAARGAAGELTGTEDAAVRWLAFQHEQSGITPPAMEWAPAGSVAAIAGLFERAATRIEARAALPGSGGIHGGKTPADAPAGDFVLRDGREVLGQHLVPRDKWSYSCDGCHQSWQGAVTDDGFPRGECPRCGGHFVYASRPLRTADEDKS